MSNHSNANKFKQQISEIEITEDFGSLLEGDIQNEVKEGSIVNGIVTAINTKAGVVKVDVGLKSEGTIPLSEFKIVDDGTTIAIGDSIDVFIEHFENRSGLTILSKERAVRNEAWHKFKEIHEQNQNIEGTIIGKVKGGFAVDIGGLVAFLPGSQIDVRPISDLSVIMGIPQPFKILKMDDKQGNLVVSRKIIMEEALREERKELLTGIQPGMLVKGTVKNITDYGVFCTIACPGDDEGKKGTLDGLLHRTDVSWEKVEHLPSMFTIGQTLDLKVINYNIDTQRISLGLKQLLPNPWEHVKDEYPVGAKCKGRVSAIVDYGVFVALSKNTDGLVYHTEISWTAKNVHPSKLLRQDQEIEVIVMDVDIEKHRISLSIKRCTENPWELMANDTPVGTKMTAIIKSISDFGIFVVRESDRDVEYPINILISSNELSWELRGDEALKEYKTGDKVECIITNIDPQYERVTASIRNLHEDRSNEITWKFIEKPSVNATITAIKRDGVIAKFERFFVYISQSEFLGSMEGKTPQDMNVGEEVTIKLLSFDQERKEFKGSFKI